MVSLTRVARGAGIALVLQVVGAGLTYLSQIAFARWMGVSQFGAYIYAMAWATLAALVLGLGFPQSVLRFIPQYRTLGDHARTHGLVRMSRRAALIGGCAVAVLGTILVAAFLRLDQASEIALVALWMIPVGVLINLDTAIIRAGGRVVGAYALPFVVRPLVLLLFTGALWSISGQITAVAAITITLVVYVAIAAIQSFFVREVVQKSRSPLAAIYDTRVWLRVSMPLLLVAGFQVALGQADLLILGATRGVRDAAYYLAATKSATLVSYVLVAVSAMTAPLFSELDTRKDRVGLQRLVAVSAQWVFWPTLLIAIGIAALAPFVLDLFGPGFSVAHTALLVLLLGQLINAACGPVGYLLSMTGYQNDTAKVYGITSALNVALCYAGARLYGLTGAACATTFSMIAWNVWLYGLTRRRLGIHASVLSSFTLRKTRLAPTTDA
ncbi:MAG TPA: oligosaccharide flippase family protein [Solirubrobacteraceae bacterium]|jgi:O-antigen/teichoic acid export membrane protein